MTDSEDKKILVMKRKRLDKIVLTNQSGENIEILVHETKSGHTTLIFRAEKTVKISVLKNEGNINGNI